MDAYTLYDYWYVLYRKRVTIYLVVALAVLFSAVLSWLLPAVYEPRTVFFIPSRPDSLTFYSETGSAQVARGPLMPEARGEQQKVFLGMLESSALRDKIHEQFPGKSVHALKRDVDFESGDDFLVEVHVRDRDPQVAADIANAYAKAFDDTLSGYSLQATERKRVETDRQLKETRTKLAEARQELAKFQKANRVGKVEEKSEGLTKYRQDMEKELDDLVVKVRQIDQKIASIRGEFGKESIVFSESEVSLSSNTIVEGLQKQISDIESQIARARSHYTESHPEVVSLRAQYKLKRRDLEEEVKRVVASGAKSPNTFVETLRQDLVRAVVDKESTQARIVGLRQALENLDRQLAAVPFMQADYQELTRRVDQYQKLVENLELTLEELAAQQSHDLKSIVVVDWATPPKTPIFPDPVINVLVAIGLGLVGGIFYAFLLDYSESVAIGVEEDLKELESEMLREQNAENAARDRNKEKGFV